jgi:hypothetical protein
VYNTSELATVTVREFRRGIEGLTASEVLVRHEKADGSTMNAIAWIVAHVAAHWTNARALASGEEPRAPRPPADGTPPDYAEALELLRTATDDLGWVRAASDERMSTRYPRLDNEMVGTFLMRAVLHTWFHTGEINAIRQLLGHPEIRFVGAFDGALDWIPEQGQR